MLTVILNIGMLPGIPGVGALFPLNGPSWSLFFELWVANLLFAMFWHSLQGKWLAALICIGAAGVIASRIAYPSLNAGAGYSTVAVGLARVRFSFFAGVAIAWLHRIRKQHISLPTWLILALIVAIFLGSPDMWAAREIEILSVLVGFPVLIYFGEESVRSSFLLSALGDASYAAYVIHWPLLLGLGHLAAIFHWHGSLYLELAFAIGITCIAFALHRYVDSPVRRWLSQLRPSPRLTREKVPKV